jgi:hypothetical protein
VVKRLTNKLWSSGLLAGWVVVLAGCGQPEQIRVYQAPKEKSEPVLEAAGSRNVNTPAGSAERPRRALPKVTYQAPKEWIEGRANDITVANFTIKAADGKSANVSIAPLPPLGMRETEVVNMWRAQMGLPEIASNEAEALLSQVEVAGEKGKMFELSTSASAAEGAQRIVTVMLHQPDSSWFYKISGDESVVAAQKTNFLNFLKTVRFEAAATPAPAAASGPTSTSSDSGWKVPAGWKEVAPGAMQNAKFSVPPQNNVTADVTVSIFPGSTGDNLANVNRWRRQIGLAEVDEAGLAKLIQPLDPNNRQAILVDMENQDKRLIAAIVPRSKGWYFYKLLGGSAAVAPQKEAFISFVRSEP